MERLISIGQFAQLSGLSPKAIRLYGDLGLLPPAAVDGWTGYRRYRPDQLPRAKLIALLRLCGVSLNEIGSFLANPTVEHVEQWEKELQEMVTSRRSHFAAVKNLVQGHEVEPVEVSMQTHEPTAEKAVKLSKAVPILASTNIDETVSFYQRRLAFKAVFQSEDYAIMSRDGVTIHFWLCDDDEIPKVTACRVQVDGVEELYRDCVAADIIHPNAPLEEKPWRAREFGVVDEHGNLITFFEYKG